uniref:Uncharacterized protein n=1 Tax=Aegilops tauschii subsp. strangulata TaxID=200361 RepID=A0A453NP85_AEGTS
LSHGSLLIRARRREVGEKRQKKSKPSREQGPSPVSHRLTVRFVAYVCQLSFLGGLRIRQEMVFCSFGAPPFYLANLLEYGMAEIWTRLFSPRCICTHC